ncbi:hypothetical protein FQZ97_1126900 [compost metagenome]
MQQRLGGHAADVQASAAQGGSTLDTGGLQPQLPGPNRRVIPAGPTAQNDHVVVAHCCSPLGLIKNYVRNMSVSRDFGQGLSQEAGARLVMKNSKRKFHRNRYKVTAYNGASVVSVHGPGF